MISKQTKTITVAVADDHALIRRGIAEMVRMFGDFDVVYEAVHGKDLIAYIERTGICPDVCLLDIAMPVMDGYETTALLKERWPFIKVIAVSLYEQEFNVVRMISRGADGYICKGDDPSKLHQAILAVTRDRFYHTDITSGRLVHSVKTGRIFRDLGLTEKELEFLACLCSDLTYDEIAVNMKLGRRTIDTHRENLFRKLNIRSRSGLVTYAHSIGLIPGTY